AASPPSRLGCPASQGPQKPLAPLGLRVTAEYQEPAARSAAGRHRPSAFPGTHRWFREMGP
ncbi:unnamed protein product, partial [Gulo gulo]